MLKLQKLDVQTGPEVLLKRCATEVVQISEIGCAKSHCQQNIGTLLLKNVGMLQFWGCCLAVLSECLDSGAVAGCGSRALSVFVAWIVLAILLGCWDVRMLQFQGHCNVRMLQFQGHCDVRMLQFQGHCSGCCWCVAWLFLGCCWCVAWPIWGCVWVCCLDCLGCSFGMLGCWNVVIQNGFVGGMLCNL